MKLKAITLRNFLSHENSYLEFPDKGLILIEGIDEDTGKSNGAGKTAICEALFYSLFGNSLRNVNLDDLVRYGMDECSVEVISDKFVVERQRKSSKKKTFLSLKVNDKVFDNDVKEVQNVINNLLGVSFFTCKNITYFSSDLNSFLDITPSERLKIFSEILELHIYDKAKERAKSRVTDLTFEVNKIDSKIGAIAKTLESIDLEELRLKYANYESEKEKQIQSLKAKIAELEHIEEPKRVEKPSDAKIKELDKIERELFGQMTSLQKAIEIEQNFIKRLRKLKDKCPVCLRPIDQEFNDKLITDSENKIKQLMEKLNDFKEEKNTIERKKKALYDDFNKKRSLYEKYLTQKEKYESSKKLLETYKLELYKLQVTENPYFDLIVKAKEQQKDLEKEFVELLAVLKELNKEKSIYSYWNTAFPRLKKRLTVNFLNLLTEFTNFFLQKLSDFSGQFYLSDKDSIEYKVIHNGKERMYESLSTGEKQIHRLASFFGLRKLLESLDKVNFSFILLDEPLAGLDNDGRQKVFDLLTMFSQNYLVLVISHSDEFKNQFDDVITIKKRNGVSYVE